jgi:hypothetical protein
VSVHVGLGRPARPSGALVGISRRPGRRRFLFLRRGFRLSRVVDPLDRPPVGAQPARAALGLDESVMDEADLTRASETVQQRGPAELN